MQYNRRYDDILYTIQWRHVDINISKINNPIISYIIYSYYI